MTTSSQTWKARVAALVSHALVGRIVAWVLRDRIRHRGCIIDTADPHIAASIKASLFWGFYESPEVRCVQRYLRQDLDVVEMGSSIGVVSAHIARRMGGTRRLICVEPNPYLLDVIRLNLALNAPHVEYRIVHGAIDYSPGSPRWVGLALGARNLGSRVVSPAPAGAAGVPAETRVPAIRLSEILAEHEIGTYALVADIEGAELGLVEHEDESLARCHQLIIELHDTTYAGRAVNPRALDGLLQSRHGFRRCDHRATVSVYER